MEILIGIVTTGITELTKILAQEFGEKLSKKIVHIIVFVLIFVGTLLIQKGVISMEMINTYIQMFASAYTTYGLIVKPAKAMILKPKK